MTDYALRRTKMVDSQVRPNDVTKFPIIDAMLSVPREAYVPIAKREAAYIGDNLDIGGGRVLLEARSLSKMLDMLDIKADELVLDLGVGLGYSTAVIAHLAEAVVAVEVDEALAGEAQAVLAAQGVDNAAVVSGPLGEAAPKHGPYDVMTIQGAVEELPQALVDQLKEGGRIAAFFNDGALGSCRIGHKNGGKINWRHAFNAATPVLPGFEKSHAFVL